MRALQSYLSFMAVICVVSVVITINFADAAIIHVPDDYSTIQNGIDAAFDYDTVLVANGIYTENIDFLGKAIVVTSENGSGITIIRILQSGTAVVTFNNNENSNSVLSGFTVDGDLSYWGVFVNNASPFIYDNIVQNHEVGIKVDGGNPTIRKNEIRYCSHSNISPERGGGIWLTNAPFSVIDSNSIHDNFAHIGGGICLQNSNSSIIERNLIYSNNSIYIGGLELVTCNQVEITNNTFVQNSGPSPYYGTIGLHDCHYTMIVNNIIAFNDDWGIHAHYGSDMNTVEYNDVYANSGGDYYGIDPGEGSINLDPLFVDIENHCYHLTANSPCINAGDPDSPFDPDSTIVDIGALYYNPGEGYIGGIVLDRFYNPIEEVHVVAINSEYEDWTDSDGEYVLGALAAPSVYDISFSHPDYIDSLITDVVVATDETTYVSIIMINPITIHVPADYLSIQDAINSAYDYDTVLVADGTYIENIDFLGKAVLVKSENGPQSTIIEIEYSGVPVVYFHNGEDTSSRFEGFTVDGDSSYWGIHCDNSSPYIYNNIIQNHEIGIRADDGSPFIRKNEICFCDHSDLEPHNGGAIRIVNASNTVIDSNIIHHNWADVAAGMMLDYSENIIIERNLFYFNNSVYMGGVDIFSCEDVDFINNTLAYNSGPDPYRGSIFIHDGINITILNNISAFNDEWGLYLEGTSQNLIVDYNDFYNNVAGDIYGVTPGPWNIYTDPLFVDYASDDYSLLGSSPCIDAGDPDSPLDPDGTTADMGALYYHYILNYGHITGAVTDTSGLPVENVLVIAVNTNINDTTDSEGAYSLDSLTIPPGIYDISFSHPDFVDTVVADIVITEDETTYLDVTLFPPPPPGAISGTVTNEESEPLEGAVIQISNTAFADTSDTDGEFFFDELTPSIYELSFSHPDYYDTVLTNVIVTSNDTTEADMVLTALPPVSDAGVSAIISPPDSVINGLDYPLITVVENFGREPQTFDVIYHLSVLGSDDILIADTITVSNMPEFSADTITFNTAFISSIDTTYNIISYTTLSGDADLSNDTSYAACQSYTDQIIVLLGGRATAGIAYNVYVEGDHAYVSDWNNGVQVYDISDLYNPVHAGGYDTPGFARDIGISGNYAYVADGIEGVQILNIQNPSDPQFAGNYGTSDRVNCILIDDHYAYLGLGLSSWFGLLIIDISDPANPYYAGNFITSDIVYRVFIDNNKAYLAAKTSVVILDISDPADPVLLGSFETAPFAYDVNVANFYAYVANGTNGIQIYDVIDPADPLFIETFETPDNALDVYISNGYVFTSVYEAGVQVVDICDFDNPVLAAEMDTPGNTRRLTLSGNNIFIADGDSLLICRFLGAEHGTITGSITDDIMSPVVGAFVTTSESEGRDFSSDIGGFVLEGLATGVYDINITHPDYNDTTITGIEVAANDTAEIEVVLEERVGIDEDARLPDDFALNQNYPNPFNANTTIEYALPIDCHVKIAVYDIMGRQIANLINRKQPAGYHKALWRTRDISSGIYFYKIQADDFARTRKMMLLK